MRKNKGISLIVLIVTIIVIIILAAVVILTINKNNPIESAKEARFKEDIRTFQYELALAISKNIIAADKKNEKITELDFEKIKDYISSFSEKYRDKIVIQYNDLRYTDKIDEKEKAWLKELNIKEIGVLLPDGYTELEYIESTGTQYIDTGFIPNQDTAVELDIQMSIKEICCIFGSRKSATVDSFQAIVGSGNNFMLDFQSYTNNRLSTAMTLDRLVIKISNSQLKAGNVIKTVSNYTNFETPGNAYIFHVSVGAPAGKAKMKLYGCKIWQSDVLVRDFIPVLDKNNIACLYDKVEEKNYYNQGTGEFLYKEKE